MSNKLVLGAGAVAAALIIVLAVVIFMVAGGGGDKKTQASASTNGGNTPTASSTSAGKAATGELRVRGTDPLFLDPAVAQDADSAQYIVEIYSGLVRLDNSLKVQPDLAER